MTSLPLSSCDKLNENTHEAARRGCLNIKHNDRRFPAPQFETKASVFKIFGGNIPHFLRCWLLLARAGPWPAWGWHCLVSSMFRENEKYSPQGAIRNIMQTFTRKAPAVKVRSIAGDKNKCNNYKSPSGPHLVTTGVITLIIAGALLLLRWRGAGDELRWGRNYFSIIIPRSGPSRASRG